jgi:hypothetical protein
MKDRYNEPDLLEVFSRWSDTRPARILGRKMQLGLGIASLTGGVGLIVEGLWNHDIEHIVGGVAGVTTGSFLTKFADVQIEQIRAETPQS